MKTIRRSIALLLILMLATAGGEGVFPAFDEVFSPMPSLMAVTGRAADEEETLADGSLKQTWRGVSAEHFDSFSVYLAGQGCVDESYTIEGNGFFAVLSKDGRSFTFRYDRAAGTAELVYPGGTFPESASAAHLPCSVAVGVIVSFGHYEQDNDRHNGREPIEWIVLAVDETEGKALIISRFGLDARPYNTEFTDVTWETCTLRAWLNDDFLSTAFTEEERNAIVPTAVDNGRTQGWPGTGTAGGDDTTDRVFLLSYDEVNLYLDSFRLRVCAPTEYAVAHGACSNGYYTASDGRAAGWWWLRSPGYYQSSAASVYPDGTFSSDSAGFADALVRPALWVGLDSMPGGSAPSDP